MLLVIRCPKCRGASRVDEPDLGQTVQCPRCADTFTAVEEAELVAPGPRSAPPAESADDRTDRATEPPAPPPPAPEPAAPPRPEAGFDQQDEQAGPLPASVLVGLALLPFLIPILWLIAPAVTGQDPVLSLGSALALAVSASVLCLAVIYTVDWRPGTRIKGVLLLVVLSYVAGVGLYFLKKEFVDRVRKFFGVELPWVESSPPGAGYKVELPSRPNPVADKPVVVVPVACLEVHHSNGLRRYRYVVGSSLPRPPARPRDPPLGSDAWFDAARDAIAAEAPAQGQVRADAIKYLDKFPGRELDFTLPNGDTRLVRLYVIKDRVYYLAVEGPGLTSDHPDAERFFSSFEVPDAK